MIVRKLMKRISRGTNSEGFHDSENSQDDYDLGGMVMKIG